MSPPIRTVIAPRTRKIAPEGAGVGSASTIGSFSITFGQEEVGRFVRELVRRLRGPPIVLLDNASTRKGDPLANLQRRHRRLRNRVFSFLRAGIEPRRRRLGAGQTETGQQSPSGCRGTDKRRRPLHQRHSLLAGKTPRLHPAIRTAFFWALIRYILYAEINNLIRFSRPFAPFIVGARSAPCFVPLTRAMRTDSRSPSLWISNTESNIR